jgi:hypothetical protein
MTTEALEGIDVARLQETLAAARAQELAGEEATAERRFREVLDATRGSGLEVAWIALANLTGLFQRQGRESEALILLRRLVDGAAAFAPFRGTWARQALCMALANIDDWDRMNAELPRFEAGIADCPEPHRTIFTRSLHALRTAAAVHHGETADARASHALLAAAVDDTAAANTMRFIHLLHAQIELRDRRWEAALDASRKARVHASSPMEEVANAAIETECLLEILGLRDAARDCARDVLDRIDASPTRGATPSHLVKAGPRLAELAADRCGDEALARRAYDLAAGAVLGRAAEIERATVELPELAAPRPEDEASLAAYRQRFREEKRRFLRAVSLLLKEKDGGFLAQAPSDFVRVCAWCMQVLRPGGERAPYGHLLVDGAGVRVTHGMCEPCRERIDGE